MLPQQYCLRWRYHHSNLQTMFSQLLEREAFCDVVLACEGRTIKAHKIVLSACSTYFDTILSQYEEKDPILIMKDVKYVDIKCLVEFMYKGEINVDHCHLATLLKTAEELRIKGLAEVSWRDEECNNEGNTNGVQSAALPQVSTVMESPKYGESGSKRKRGRPPIDDYDQSSHQQSPQQQQQQQEQPFNPKIVSVTGNAEETYSNDAMSSSDQDLSIWEDENAPNDMEEVNESDEPAVQVKTEAANDDDIIMEDPVDPISTGIVKTEPSIKILNSTLSKNSLLTPNTSTGNSSFMNNSSSLTAALEKEWPDVIKMNDYLNTGRRQQFWEEPFTKRVMDAIKNKNLEMKIAAELLGVSYGTLYGRYRDAYGCLKHPYRVRDFWTEQGPTDVLLKLKRKEITLFRAAEQLNVTPQTLSNYLISMSVLDNEATLSGHLNPNETFDAEAESEDESDSILPDVPSNSGLFKNVISSNNSTATSSNSVLANCPDITIIKKEKLESATKVNNNSDHSDRQSGGTSDQPQK